MTAQSPPSLSVVLAATFTIDPLAEPLGFLLGEAGLPAAVTVAPYGQVFQELLDSRAGFAGNRGGVNVIVIRLEDWSHAPPNGDGAGAGAGAGAAVAALDRNVDSFI